MNWSSGWAIPLADIYDSAFAGRKKRGLGMGPTTDDSQSGSLLTGNINLFAKLCQPDPQSSGG
jgi:hypothetical protein